MINLSETYTYEGHENWSTGKRCTAQKKIKTGDTVRITFLGASEEEININHWNGIWEMDETISVMGENFYFEVVVNGNRAYYAKTAGYRYTKASDTLGGGARLTVTRTCISDKEVRDALQKLKGWLYDGAKENNYWHGIYKKTEFPEKIAYGMPGEEAVVPATETVWKVGDVIEEGDGVFIFDGIRYEVFKDYVNGKERAISVLKVLPLKGDTYAGKVTIPEIVSYHRRKLSVTEVDYRAFDNCPELTELVVPKTITYIPSISGSPKVECVTVAEENPYYRSLDGVLYGQERYGRREKGEYSELLYYPPAHPGEHFVIPEFVESIAAFAFSNCQKLKSVVLADKVTSICEGAFQNCINLKSITWGASLRFIWGKAFENCTALKSIVFTDSIEDVSSDAFRGCTNISSISFARGKYFDLDSLPKEFFPWGQNAFTLDGVRYAPYKAFDREEAALLAVVDLPKDADTVFPDITTLIIPAKVEHYGFIYKVSECKSSFKQFPSLKRLELPSTVIKVDIAEIENLQEVVVDKGNTEFSTEDGVLFNKQKTVLLSFPRRRDVKEYLIPDGVEQIAEEAFRGQPYIEEIVFPDSTIAIEKRAFADCRSLREVHLGKNIKKIGIESFAYTAIERFVLTPNARFVNQHKWDGKTPFYGSKLKAFELDGENELYTVIDGILYIKNSWGLRLKFCPPAYEGHLQIPEEVKVIGSCSCWGCTGITSLFIPEGVETIGDDAFSGCTKLESVDIDGHIDKLGSWCFAGCTALKEIDCIGVKSIEDTAFAGDKGLKLNLPFALEKNRSKYEQYMNR